MRWVAGWRRTAPDLSRCGAWPATKLHAPSTKRSAASWSRCWWSKIAMDGLRLPAIAGAMRKFWRTRRPLAGLELAIEPGAYLDKAAPDIEIDRALPARHV